MTQTFYHVFYLILFIYFCQNDSFICFFKTCRWSFIYHLLCDYNLYFFLPVKKKDFKIFSYILKCKNKTNLHIIISSSLASTQTVFATNIRNVFLTLTALALLPSLYLGLEKHALCCS